MDFSIIPVPSTVRIDLTGKTFGRLTVIGFHERRNARLRWTCQCECGNKTVADASNLRRGITTSCGCYAREFSSKNNFRHGLVRTGAYASWQSMKNRCENKNDSHYPGYGGRGIKVCDRWKDDFNAFIADMGERPRGATIGRIDNHGDYEPSNCRWETVKQQANNTRGNHLVTYNGETLTVQQLAEKIGMNHHTFRSRLHQGKSVKEAVERPVKKRKATV